MRFLIASDVHGSSFYAKEILELVKKEKADKVVLLGDIYNHGPRNPLPKDYNPGEVANMLNSIKENLIVIKGNCDSQVDTLISEFDFLEGLCIVDFKKAVYFTHGHVYNKDRETVTKFDAVVYGHFHTGFIERKGETLYANAGSISLPKNGTPNSYLILENGILTLKNLSGEIIKKEQI